MAKGDLLAEVNGLSTPVLLAGLVIISGLLASCSELAAAPESGPRPGEFSPDGGSDYGVDGFVSDYELSLVQGLAWPQDRQAMTTLIGYPLRFTEFADYYTISGGRWLVIQYSGPNATGYQLEDQ